MFVLLSAFLLFVAIYLYLYFQNAFTYWKKLGVDCLPPKFPFGNITDLMLGRKGFGEIVESWYEQTEGRFSGIYAFNVPLLFVKDPELIKCVLVKDFNSFVDRGIYTDEKKEKMSGHLFRLNGSKWRSMRSKLTPTFTTGKLKMMFNTIVEVGKRLGDTIEENPNTIIDIEDISTRYNIDIIGSVIFGLDINSFEDKNNGFFLMGKDLFNSYSFYRIIKAALLIFIPNTFKFLNVKTVQETQRRFIYKMVQDVIEHRQKNKITRNDMMQLLIQLKNKGRVNPEDNVEDVKVFEEENHKNCLSLNEVAAQAYTFFFAGFETSSTTMNFLLYECALNENLQRKIQAEIDEVDAKYCGSVTYDSIQEMEFLDRCISETLRKYPVLTFLNRVATKNYKIPDSDVTIEKGIRVFLSVSGLHHDPKYYPNPDKFDPDRFAQENFTKTHPFAYLPFGDGPRNCIGQRMGKIMVAVGISSILRNYSVSICEETINPMHYNRLAYFTKSAKPIKLKITKRTQITANN